MPGLSPRKQGFFHILIPLFPTWVNCWRCFPGRIQPMDPPIGREYRRFERVLLTAGVLAPLPILNCSKRLKMQIAHTEGFRTFAIEHLFTETRHKGGEDVVIVRPLPAINKRVHFVHPGYAIGHKLSHPARVKNPQRSIFFL